MGRHPAGASGGSRGPTHSELGRVSWAAFGRNPCHGLRAKPQRGSRALLGDVVPSAGARSRSSVAEGRAPPVLGAARRRCRAESVRVRSRPRRALGGGCGTSAPSGAAVLLGPDREGAVASDRGLAHHGLSSASLRQPSVGRAGPLSRGQAAPREHPPWKGGCVGARTAVVVGRRGRRSVLRGTEVSLSWSRRCVQRRERNNDSHPARLRHHA